MPGAKIFIFLLLTLTLSGCKVHDVLDFQSPTVEVPPEYLEEIPGVCVQSPWWEEFQDQELNEIMECAFCGNLSIKQAWDRFKQAGYQTVIDGSERYPQLGITSTAIHTKVTTEGESQTANEIPDVGLTDFSGISGTTNRITLTPELTYEVDLFRKIDSRARASCKEYAATREDYAATALTMTGQVTELWFTIQQQRQLLALLDEQIRTNETQLELLELRFSVGQSTALDVYQQRLILAERRAQVPPVLSRLQTANHSLRVLMGHAPDHLFPDTAGGNLVELPPFPERDIPLSLLYERPDLRASFQRLAAADNLVAARIAERFPQINLSLSYEFSAFEWNRLFDREVATLMGNIFQPLIDWGRRRAAVQKQKARVCELLHGYGESFLNALLEVENAVAEEKQQIELIKRLHEQEEYAKINLEEARWQYINGQIDYLTVIAAIQALQNVQTQIINEHKNLLSIRARLYRALGGYFTL